MEKKVLIVEDEQLNAERLRRFIAQLRPEYKIVGILESVADAVSWLKNNECPDLLLLDVRLADGLSFCIFDQIEIDCPIIFTTAYDEYAVKAFKLNSVDYLLKPIEQDELLSAIVKLEKQHQFNIPVKELVKYLKQEQETFRTRFLLPYRDGYKTLLVTDIHYIYLEHKITYAKLLKGTSVALPLSMEELEQQLDPHSFFRANRQFIIHIDAIEHILNGFNGKLKIIMKTSHDTDIIISREKSQQFKHWLNS